MCGMPCCAFPKASLPCRAMRCKALPTLLNCAAACLQDGKTTSEEVLRAMVLDGAVDDEAVDADVFEVFDK